VGRGGGYSIIKKRESAGAGAKRESAALQKQGLPLRMGAPATRENPIGSRWLGGLGWADAPRSGPRSIGRGPLLAVRPCPYGVSCLWAMQCPAL
jgi:hypothetical protein